LISVTTSTILRAYSGWSCGVQTHKSTVQFLKGLPFCKQWFVRG
jgi:hypothetical protein